MAAKWFPYLNARNCRWLVYSPVKKKYSALNKYFKFITMSAANAQEFERWSVERTWGVNRKIANVHVLRF